MRCGVNERMFKKFVQCVLFRLVGCIAISGGWSCNIKEMIYMKDYARKS